jgi:lysophospholipase L1-like esterase
MRVAASFVLALGLLAAACSSSPNQPSPTPPTPPVTTPPPPPRLGKLRYVAFGDSLTEGTVSAPITFTLTTVPYAYPARLNDALHARYTAQPEIVVFNEGKAGEFALDGKVRLPDAIKADTPDVVLLMEGANEISLLGRKGISRAVGALEDMIKDTQRRGVIVRVATLPPQRAGGVRADGAPYIDELNAQIRKTALDEGATLVDVGAQLDLSFVGGDGLHLTEAGYTRLAEIFATAIRAAFELPPAS